MAIQTSSSNKYSVAEDQKTGSTIIPFILVTSLFFMWGVANNLNDILIKQFKKSFELSDIQSGLVQSAFYMGYFLLALPAAQIMKKHGYKTGIIIGLLLYALGAFLFYPAAEVRMYGFFLFALFVIASGLAFLETAANPYVTVLGSPETATRRLNLSQSFNALGAISGILIGKSFIFSGVEYTTEELKSLGTEQAQAFLHAETRAVQMPYLIIGAIVVIWTLLIFFTKFPDIKEAEDEGVASTKGFKHLFANRHFTLGVIAQFFYVGSQVGIWSYMIRYSQNAIPGTSELVAADYLTYALVCFMVGRFVGTALMNYIKPNQLMAAFAFVNILLVAISIFVGGLVGIWALIITSVFMSVMFPTIFALSIKGLGPDTKTGSSFVIMAIVGGAVLTPAMGLISDASTIAMAFLVPLIGFTYICWYSLKGFRATAIVED